jgi:hypothetical protein
LKVKNALKLHTALDPLKGLKFEQFNKTLNKCQMGFAEGKHIAEKNTLKPWNFETCRGRDEVQIH